MSTPAVTEREFHRPNVPPSSRLIPGLAFPHPGAPRKRPLSVTWDRRYWIEEETESRPLAQEPNLAAAMRRAILPTLAEGGDRYELLTHIAADFLVATLTLSIVTSFLANPGSGSALLPVIRLSSALIYAVLLTLLAHSEGLYRPDTTSEMERVILGKVVAWTTLLMTATLCATGILPVDVLATTAPLGYFGLLAWRTWRYHQRKRRSGGLQRNVLIVGAGKIGRTLAKQLACEGSRPRMVCGFLDDDEPIAGEVLGRSEDIARIARAEFVDEIILADIRSEVAQRVIREARRNRLDVKVVPEHFCSEFLGLERYGDTPVLTIHEEPVPAVTLLAKRVMDIALSVPALMLSAPFLTAIALLVKLDSPGPVFYRAPRVGKKGREFLCCKFRTMRTDADRLKEELRATNEREGAFFKMAGDPRITRVGRILRRYSLDELPQLLNVFRGEMSMVGPRPHPLDDCARYRLQDLRRLDVMPGITGLWQVTARSDPSFERSMALDLEYIEGWNLWVDLKILCRTAWIVVQGNGA